MVTAPEGPCSTMLLEHRIQGNRTWFDVIELHEPPPRTSLLKYELEFTSPDGNKTRTRGNLSDGLHEVDGNGVRYLERNGSSEHVNLGDAVAVNRTNVTAFILLEWDPEFEDWTHLTIAKGWTGCL